MTEKAKGSRIRGFKGSSGLLGIFFQNIKAKGARQKAEDRGQRSEGWKVGKKTEKPDRGLEGWLNIYTSTHITF